MTTTQGRRGDEGSVLPLTAIVVAVAVIAAMVLVAIVDGSVRRARAQIAADSAALAAAAEADSWSGANGSGTSDTGDGTDTGRLAAIRLVESNGAELVEYRQAWVERPTDESGQLGSMPLRVTIVADYLGVKAVATAERSVRTLGTQIGRSERPETSAPSLGRAIPASGYADLELGAG